jgi:hypothetical protein
MGLTGYSKTLRSQSHEAPSFPAGKIVAAAREVNGEAVRTAPDVVTFQRCG